MTCANEQSDAALVGVAVRDHHRVRAAVPGRYPGLGSYPGKLGWTMRGEYDQEVEKANKELAPLYAQFTAKKTEDLASDAKAMAIGERLFMNNCAQCHGSDARGSKGFPNLTDSDWLHGGTPEKIEETITLGGSAQMPPMAAAVGTPDDVKNVANYVLSLSDSPHDSVRAELGKAKFTVCAACHGIGRQGQPGHRRAQPDRRHLAARLGRAGHHRHGQQRQDQPDAGPGRQADRGADPRAGRLRLGPVEQACPGQAMRISLCSRPPSAR